MIVYFENVFSACVNAHSCCSEVTAPLLTSLQYPSDFQKQRQKRENSMRPYKSRVFTEFCLERLENTDFLVSGNFRVKAVTSVVYAISLITQNLPIWITHMAYNQNKR